VTGPDPLVFDLEGADAGEMRTGNHEGPFVRLIGADAAGQQVVADRSAGKRAVVRHIEQAPLKTGHNILGFDIPALVLHEGGDWDRLMDGAVDTLVAARLADPPGAKRARPWSTKGYYSLDQVAQRYGVSDSRNGSKGTLNDLKEEFGGYDKIPVDDARYRSYLRDDLAETRAIYEALRPVIETPYARREMRVVALQQRMTHTGWRVDVPLLHQLAAGEERNRLAALDRLHDENGLPARGMKSPLGTKLGKQWFNELLEQAGAEPWWPMTATGLPSMKGEHLDDAAVRKDVAVPPELLVVLELVREVTGATSKYAEILHHTHPDGRVYPGIGADQASGRWATTKPATANLGKRDGKHVQRAPFLPEPGHVMITFDLDQVDMRAIAALSQDPSYMALFGPGLDAHSMIADLVFGRHDGPWRHKSKKCGHGWNYGMGINGLVRSGVEREIAETFDREMMNRFPVLCSERDKWRATGAAGQLLDNGFGRWMRPVPERSHTQSPALMGQGAARDVMCEGMLRLDPAVQKMLRAVVHDEIVLSVPERHLEEISGHVLDALTWNWRDVPITAGASAPGYRWSECYQTAA